MYLKQSSRNHESGYVFREPTPDEGTGGNLERCLIVIEHSNEKGRSFVWADYVYIGLGPVKCDLS